MNAKVYLGKENNEETCGLASDVLCTLVQPISAQDRDGRNVTTDNFFTSVDLANQLKNKKKLTLLGKRSKTNEKFQEFKPAKQRDENLSIFGFTKDLTLVSYVPKKNKSVVLLSSLHHDSANCSDSGKPEIIEFYDKTKGAVDMLDQPCARYTVQRATRRWAMAMFYGMINIAAVNALVIYTHNMRKDQPEKKLKRKEFLLRISHDLVTPFVTQRYKISSLPRNIKIAIVMCGFVSDSEENTMQEPGDYEVISRKRGLCHICSSSRDVKTQFVRKECGHYFSKGHMSMIVTCDTCNNKDETSNHFIIFTFLNTEMNIESNRNSYTI